jgi:superfamily I DNA/RNA helicase/RecB family exonuclease
VDWAAAPLARVLPDESQLAALTLVRQGGPVSVFGAPGTGKTLVAELAAAEAVQAGRAVLVLSPERHAAKSLAARVVRRAGVPLERRVAVTPAALAMTVLQARAEAIAAQPWDGAAEAARAYQPQMVTGAEQMAAFGELLAMEAETGLPSIGWPDKAPPAARTLRAFRAELRDLLMRAAERGLDAVALESLGRSQSRPEWVAAARFYQAYLEGLDVGAAADSGLKLDVAAMVSTAHACLRDWCEPFHVAGQSVELPAASKPRWDLVIVDDHQEASLALHRLVGQFGADGAQLVLLGSPESAVQAYRGALPGQLAATLAPPAAGGSAQGGWGARPAVLSQNWRQGGDLALNAHRLRLRVRSPGAPRAARTIPAAAPSQGVVRAWAARSEADVAALVARRLRWARIVEGVDWDQMAVLARTSGRVSSLRSMLTSAGVPVRVPGSEVLAADHPAVAPLVTALRCAADPAQLTAAVAVKLLTSAVGGFDAARLRVLRRSLVAAARASGIGATSDELLVAVLGGAGLPDADRPSSGSPDAGSRGAGLPDADRPSGGSPDVAERGAGLPDADRPSGEPLADPSQLLAAARAAGLSQRDATRVTELAAALTRGRARARAPKPSAAQTLWAVWDALGLAETWRAQALAGGAEGVRADSDLDAVLALFAAAGRLDERRPGSGVAGLVAYLDAQEVPSDTIAAHAPPSGKVTLATVAAAAGHEWDLVVVLDLEENVWPDLRLRDTLLGAGELADLIDGKGLTADPVERRRAVAEDEARALLLAATRARRELVAVAVAGEESRPSRFFGWIAASASPMPGADREIPAHPQPEGGGAGGDRAASAAGTAGAVAGMGTGALDVGNETRVAGGDRSASAAGSAEDWTAGAPLPFDLRGVVAAARARLVARPDGADAGRAAAVLAVLAALGKPGAHPGSWPGLLARSTDRPLWPEGRSPVLSPSRLEQLAECPLGWALRHVGGDAPAGAAASLGTLVHSLAEEFGSAAALERLPGRADLRARLRARLAERWPELELVDGYSTRLLGRRAEIMVDNLAQYLDERRGLRRVALEARISPDGADLPVRLRGVVDRIEEDDSGAVRVVDFKTGAAAPTIEAAKTNPQLGAYQAALAAGSVEGFGPTRAREAALVYLEKTSRDEVKELRQPGLAVGDPWVSNMLAECRAAAAQPTIEARPGSHCRNCPVTASCPAKSSGKQVTA